MLQVTLEISLIWKIINIEEFLIIRLQNESVFNCNSSKYVYSIFNKYRSLFLNKNLDTNSSSHRLRKLKWSDKLL